ncbi:MAG TPA: universal stress protein [Microvirga sp.]|nr:universal stress protein [Microvirga sp.]
MAGSMIGIPKTILLATDLSPRCDRATDRAVALAGEWQAMLVVLHVLEDAEAGGLHDYGPVPSWRRPPDPVAVARQRLLEDLGPAVAQSRIRIREGEPVDTILATAEAEGCDLIVTGVAQDEEFGRFRLGKSVDRLLRRSRVPLLVVRNRARAAYRTVVAATDFSDPARHALQVTDRLFPECKLTLFHAYDVPRQTLADNPATFRKACEDAVMERCERFLKQVGLLGRHRPRPDVLVEQGDPARLLREYVRVAKVDLVTMGTRGSSGFLDMFLGSTAKEILAELPCDALVVRDPQASVET